MAIRDIIVHAGNDRYTIIFSDRNKLSGLIQPYNKIAIISNPTIWGLWGNILTKEYISRGIKIYPIVIGDGERYKNQTTINHLIDQLLDIGLDRKDAIIAFGGGMVGDTAGFAAAIYKRGIDLIYIPTSLLAIVDSSIGGKVGINHSRGKNLVGTFYQSRGVFIEPNWLHTLPEKYYRDGLAEVIKTGYLTNKPILNMALKVFENPANINKADLIKLIWVAAKFKADIVAQDPREENVRSILNLGHTFAHAIEKAEGMRRYRHGQAVLAGIAGALYLSRACGYIDNKQCDTMLGYIKPATQYLPKLKKSANDYIYHMKVDKKNTGDVINFVLPEGIGRTVVCPVQNNRKIAGAVRQMIAFVNDN